MEDWKSAREEDDLEDIVPPMNHPNHGNTDRIDQSQEHDNGVQQEARRSSGTGRSRRGSSSNRPRLSIVETEDDWEEQDAALKNAKETAYTLLEKECAADDVIRVWECISKFVTFKLLEGQAVRIAGLGTFTYRIHKTPVNQKTVKVTKAPIFQVSQYVTQMFRLQQDKMISSNVPVVPLNLSVIAVDTKMPRGLVEGILTEVLQAFARAIVCNKLLEFPFPFIGKLQIRDQKVTMRFYDEFCKKLGFHVVETPSEANLLENMIPGRMTPLRLHIPTEPFRSVFHLREVLSVHEFPLVVPLTQIDRKLVPETLAASESGEKSGKNKPLYEPQKTGDCVLDLMNACPEVMTRCLRAHLYKTFVDTLGEEVVKSHFRRRGNKCPSRDFSFYNLDMNM